MNKKTLTILGPALVGLVVVLILLYSTRATDQGAELYAVHCQSCHMENGQGLRGVIPPVAKADYLSIHRAELACLIRYGAENPMVVNGKTYQQAMPGNEQLTETDIANVLNYVLKSWGNEEKPLSLQEVQNQLEACD